MPGQQFSSVVVVEVDGQELPDDMRSMLTSAQVEDDVHVPDRFILRFRDPHRTVLRDSHVRIGSAIRVLLSDSDSAAATPLVDGEVTALEAEFDGVSTSTTVRGLDKLHRLLRGRQAHVYLQTTVADVARAIAGRAGIPVGDLDPGGPVLPHLGQGTVSDWDFLQRLARENGFEVVMEDGRLHVRRPVASGDAPPPTSQPEEEPLVLQLGVDLLVFRSVITSADQVSEVQVRGWDVTRKQALVGTAPAATTSASVGTAPRALADQFGGRQFVTGAVPYAVQAEVDAAAKALAESLASSFCDLEGVARGNPALRAGRAVRLVDVGAPFDGTYTLTSVRHLYNYADGYRTSFTVSGRHQRSLLRLTSGGQDGGQLTGLAVAQVSDTSDPEHRLRVKLKFPWLSDDYVTDWTRVVQPGAGDNRGFILVPEVGDEVLVGFEHGDLRRPYVLGGLYNGVDAPSHGSCDTVDGTSGQVTLRRWASRTGHRLEFAEATGTSGVLLATGDDKQSLHLDATGTAITLHGDGKVRVEASGGTSVEMSNGTIRMEAGGGSSIELGNGSITLSAGGASLKVSSGSVSVTGQVKVGM